MANSDEEREETARAVIGTMVGLLFNCGWSEYAIQELCNSVVAEREDAHRKAEWKRLDEAAELDRSDV